jgi:hypothetical protein
METSNEKRKKMIVEGSHRLSMVSRNYDLGNKGFLTDTEQQMRGMDSDNVGHLDNAKVSAVVAETLLLRDKNNRMKMWIGILGLFVIILALSNLGTAFAAAWLAKDTTVNESTGQLMMKDSDTPVTVRANGQTSNLVFEDESNTCGCMNGEEAATLWNGVLDGTASVLAIQDSSQLVVDDPSMQNVHALLLTASGATRNETMVCMPVASNDDSGGKVCIDFTDNRCDASSDQTGRALEVMDHDSRRKLFHAAAQGFAPFKWDFWFYVTEDRCRKCPSSQ